MAEPLDPAPQLGAGCRRRLRRTLLATLVVLTLALSWLLASTRPFTWQADLLTAVGFGALSVVAVWRVLSRTKRDIAPLTGTRWWPWLALFAALGAWELVTYLAGMHRPRSEFPTISSLYDTAARWRVVKTFFVALWLWLGWQIGVITAGVTTAVGATTATVGTISSVVWIALAVVLVALESLALSGRANVPELRRFLARVSHGFLRRGICFVAWMWLGWHFFAR